MTYQLGQDTLSPPPVEAPPKYAMAIGWGAVLAITVGIFYATVSGRPVAANRKRRRRSSRRPRRRSSRLRSNKAKRRSTRRSSRRPSRRRSSKRPSLRRYKALSATARRRMPDKDFALSGRRFPIAGPPGSSRERDKWQAMQAVRYLNMGRVGTKQDYLKVRNAIIRRYGMSFWRGYDGPTWPKIQKAKRRAGATRRRSSLGRLAANTRRVRRNPKVSEADRKFAEQVAFGSIPSGAAKKKLRAEIRDRLPPPNAAEVKKWNRDRGTDIMEVMAIYAKRVGIPGFAGNLVLQIGWQNSKGQLKPNRRAA